MAVLIYGEHRVSEPWAYDIAREVLSRNRSIIGVECPQEIMDRTDWIMVFNKYVQMIRSGQIPKPVGEHGVKDSLWHGLNYEGHLIFELVHEWIEDINRIYKGQIKFNIHGTHFLTDSSKTELARMQFHSEFMKQYKRLIQQLGTKYSLGIEEDSTIGEETIEIALPLDIPHAFGIREEYTPELEEIINAGPNQERIRDGIRIISLKKWKGKFVQWTLNRASCYLLPDTSNPKYKQAISASVNFLDEFFRNL